MTSFQIVSDLHIERFKDDVDPFQYIKKEADVLVMAGDIGSLYRLPQLTLFLKKLCDSFTQVLFVPGNHEYYTLREVEWKKSFKTLQIDLKIIEKSIPNLTVLHRKTVMIGDVCIAGCTLWSQPSISVPNYIVRIDGFRTRQYKRQHQEDLCFLHRTIKQCKKSGTKLAVITHHPPSFSLMKKKGRRKDKYRSLYVTNLDYMISKENMAVWVSGHIHFNSDIMKNGTRLVSNQLGKRKDHVTDFNQSLVVEI
jgi:predicted phosphohydrolase